MNVCMYMYVCMYSTYVFIYVCMYVCMYVYVVYVHNSIVMLCMYLCTCMQISFQLYIYYYNLYEVLYNNYVILSLDWYIGSEPESSDIFPRTDVSHNNGRSARFDDGVLYIDDFVYSNISDIIALADGVSPSEVDGLFIEPGRLFYHTLEFCSLSHTCVISEPQNAIVISE